MFGSIILEDFFQEQQNFSFLLRRPLGLILHVLILSKFRISTGARFLLQSGQIYVNNSICSMEKTFKSKLPTPLIQKATGR